MFSLFLPSLVGCAINRQGVNGLEGAISDERDLLGAFGGKEEEDSEFIRCNTDEPIGTILLFGVALVVMVTVILC